MKGLHQPMKKWYAGQAGVEPKWGAFPLFWQDLGTWAPYREVKKKYLMFTEGLTVTIEENASADAATGEATTTTVTAAATVETAGAEPATVSLASISGGLAAVAEAVAEAVGGVAAVTLASVEGSVISDGTSAAGDGEPAVLGQDGKPVATSATAAATKKRKN
eukprot:2482-Heterococcus_DN1.PRE.4